MVLGNSWLKRQGSAIITYGYNPEHVQPASIDLCLDNDDNDSPFEVSKGNLCIPAGVHTLLATKEVIAMPDNVCAQIVLKSSIARRGLVMGAGHVDPGFRGQLTVCVMTANKSVSLKLGAPFCQLRFYSVGYIDKGYEGKYLDSVGAVADRTEEVNA